MQAQIQVAADVNELNRAVANWWLTLSQQAISARGGFYVALAGGSTPRALYQLLAQPDYANTIQWEKVHIYFGDERSVPLDHEDSNYCMAREALLSKVDIPEQNIHAMHIDVADIELSAKNYQATLQRTLGAGAQGIPQFDLILLGMGNDGHTASLFPGTSILAETEKLVSPVYVDKLNTWRLSLTYPVINHARHIAIVVAGEAKADKLHEIFVDNVGSNPIERIAPEGKLIWFLDAVAAKRLPLDTLCATSITT